LNKLFCKKILMPRIIAIATLVLLVEFTPAATVILNPSFENSDMSAWTRTAITGIRPWSRGAASPQDGSWYVFAPDDASISQTFAPIRGNEIYQFTLWVDRPTTANMFIELTYLDGSSSGQINMNDSTGPGWGSFDVLPSIEPSKELNGFSVTKLGTGSARLDNFQLTLVPEPSTLSFLGSGLALIFRRKRQQVMSRDPQPLRSCSSIS
jgi:hypothetical protein